MKEVFVAGKPVFGSTFYDRKEVIKSITSDFGNNYALVGIRRVGKTSILKQLEIEFKKKGIIPVRIDVRSIFPFTIEGFLKKYTLEIVNQYKKEDKYKHISERLKLFLKGEWRDFAEYIKTIHIQAFKDIAEIWFDYDQSTEKDRTKLLKEVINYPEKLAKDTNKKIVIMFDEFQEVQKFGEDFMWALRSNMQESQNTEYIISGSAVGTMSYILGNKNSPFYGMFLTKQIKGIDEKSAGKLLDRVKEFDITLGQNLKNKIIKKTNCLPLYLQAIGKIILLHFLEKKKNVGLRQKDKKNETFKIKITKKPIKIFEGMHLMTEKEFEEIWEQLFREELYFHFIDADCSHCAIRISA